MTDEEFKAKKKENIKLNKEAQSLMAMYRKELDKSFASMKQDFDYGLQEQGENDT